MIIRRLIVPLTFAAVVLHTGQAFAQGAFSAQSALSGASDTCMNGFAPLREQAEARGKLIKEASERHAPPNESCKLIGSFGQSEIKMIKYIEANSARCGITPEIADRPKAGHKNTEAMLKKVCAVAQQAQTRQPAGPVGDFDDFRTYPLTN